MKHKHEILRLRSEGLTYRQIEKRLGCSRSLVSYHCAHLPRPVRTVEPDEPENAIPAEKAAICDALLRAGVKPQRIAEVLAVSHDAVVFRRRERHPIATRSAALQPGYTYVKASRARLKLLGIALLGGRCSLCGYDRCPQALDFHHRDPSQKDFNIARNTNLAWERVKAELAKCVLLCATCHREVHAGVAVVPEVRPG